MGRVTTGRGTDPTGRDMDIRSQDTDTLSRATTATPIRIAVAITIHTEDTALAAVRTVALVLDLKGRRKVWRLWCACREGLTGAAEH